MWWKEASQAWLLLTIILYFCGTKKQQQQQQKQKNKNIPAGADHSR